MDEERSELDNGATPPDLANAIRADAGSSISSNVQVDKSKDSHNINLPMPWLIMIGMVAALGAALGIENTIRQSDSNAATNRIDSHLDARLTDIAANQREQIDSENAHTREALSDAKKEWRLADNSSTELNALLEANGIRRDEQGHWHVEEVSHGRSKSDHHR